MQPGPMIDDRSNFQRARRSELVDHCRAKAIPLKPGARKDDILKVLDAQVVVNIPAPPRSETDDEKRARLTAELSALEGPKIFSTKALNGEEPGIEKPDFENMMHHKKKAWLIENSPKAGVEVRFPGAKGKGPEVTAECHRIFAML